MTDTATKQDVTAELLEALKAAAEYIHDEIGRFGARDDYMDTDTLRIVENAIAKAEGR